MKCNINGGLPVNSTASARRIEPNAAFTSTRFETMVQSESLRQPLLFIAGPLYSDHLERPLPNGFGWVAASLSTGQSDERNFPPALRPFARKEQRILAHSAEVGRQPVANINKPLLQPLRHVMMSPSNSHLNPWELRSLGCALAQRVWHDRGAMKRLPFRWHVSYNLRADPFIGWPQPVDEHGRR